MDRKYRLCTMQDIDGYKALRPTADEISLVEGDDEIDFEAKALEKLQALNHFKDLKADQITTVNYVGDPTIDIQLVATEEMIAQLRLIVDYDAQIRSWDWEGIKQNALGNVQTTYEKRREGLEFLGTVFAIYPSGKFYMPWSSNITEVEALEDEEFREALEAVASEYGMWITNGEGNPCDIFAGISVDEEDDEDDKEEEDGDLE